MSHKIGIGIITCNRPDFFKQCVDSMPSVDTIVVINDGAPYEESIYPSTVKEVIQHSRNKSVGVSKNEALRFLMQDKCDSLFIAEDDITIQNPNICEKYIKTSEASGIWHLNYGGHGSYNRNPQTGEVLTKNVINYDGTKVDFYHNILGAWSYYLRGVIKAVGYMDERFYNAAEHIDHTYRIIKEGLHPPFWWFADAHDSWMDIKDIKANFEGSEIRKDKAGWEKNMKDAWLWYQHKHGFMPTRTPETSEQSVIKSLELIQQNYSRKVL